VEDSINSVINHPCHLESAVHSYLDLLITIDRLLTERGVEAIVRVLEDYDASFKASVYRKANYYTKGRLVDGF
jgi:chorismate mutase